MIHYSFSKKAPAVWCRPAEKAASAFHNRLRRSLKHTPPETKKPLASPGSRTFAPLLPKQGRQRSCMYSGSTSTAAANNMGSSTNSRFTVVPRTVTRLPS